MILDCSLLCILMYNLSGGFRVRIYLYHWRSNSPAFLLFWLFVGRWETNSKKAISPRIIHVGSLHDDVLHEDYNSDIDLSLDDFGGLFGNSFDETQLLFENGGIDSFFEIGNYLDAEFDEESKPVAKGSDRKRETLLQACTFSSNSITSCKSDPNICFPRAALAPSTLSLSVSGYTNESSTGDHQECGVSPVLWEEIHLISLVLKISSRQLRVIVQSCDIKRKRNRAGLIKRLRYASRKARADSRKRVKGRFVRTGDPYDYDPSHLTRS